MSEEKEILLIIMYNGKFLRGETHIGHEIINLFKCDNGKNYIYVLPDGKVPERRQVEAILLGRRSGPKIEILAKAEGLKNLQNDSEKKDQKITYNGVPLGDIFSGDKNVPITFQADKVTKPKRPIYISSVKPLARKRGTGEYFLPGVALKARAQRRYFSNQKHKKAYEILKKNLVKKKSVWGKETTTIAKAQKKNDNRFNFFQIINKEYDEVSFSNMFKYVFSSDVSILPKFAEDCLKTKDWSEDFEIRREFKKTDILLMERKKDKDKQKPRIIIIENKIRAPLGENQLERYWKTVREEKEFKDKGYKVQGFVFVPDYNTEVIEAVKKDKHYKDIRYSKIYDFFKNTKSRLLYYEDFVSALKKHTGEIDNYWEEYTYKKFWDAIQRAKKTREQASENTKTKAV